MCFSVQVDIDLKKLAFDLRAQKKINTDNYKKTAVGYTKTETLPVVYFENEFVIEEMIWSLVPPWAKEFPLKWNTYNARMERKKDGIHQRIYDVPTFKNAFRKNQFCYIPIHSAIEACYWGEPAGKIAAFKRKDNRPFYVLGLYDTYQDKKTCTLLTDGPYKYFFENGHDRSVVVFNKEKIDILTNKNRTHEETFDFIKQNRVDQEWSFETVREMKEGWQKRVPTVTEIKEVESEVY